MCFIIVVLNQICNLQYFYICHSNIAFIALFLQPIIDIICLINQLKNLFPILINLFKVHMIITVICDPNLVYNIIIVSFNRYY